MLSVDKMNIVRRKKEGKKSLGYAKKIILLLVFAFLVGITLYIYKDSEPVAYVRQVLGISDISGIPEGTHYTFRGENFTAGDTVSIDVTVKNEPECKKLAPINVLDVVLMTYGGIPDTFDLSNANISVEYNNEALRGTVQHYKNPAASNYLYLHLDQPFLFDPAKDYLFFIHVTGAKRRTSYLKAAFTATINATFSLYTRTETINGKTVTVGYDESQCLPPMTGEGLWSNIPSGQPTPTPNFTIIGTQNSIIPTKTILLTPGLSPKPTLTPTSIPLPSHTPTLTPTPKPISTPQNNQNYTFPNSYQSRNATNTIQSKNAIEKFFDNALVTFKTCSFGSFNCLTTFFYIFFLQIK